MVFIQITHVQAICPMDAIKHEYLEFYKKLIWKQLLHFKIFSSELENHLKCMKTQNSNRKDRGCGLIKKIAIYQHFISLLFPFKENLAPGEKVNASVRDNN